MKKKKDEAPVILNAETQTMVDSAENKSRARKDNYLLSKYADGELVIWPDGERGIPNELVRCALFSAKNRKEKEGIFPLRIHM